MSKSQSRRHGGKASKQPAPATTPSPNTSLQPTARWQRAQRYGWDKGGARGGRK